MTRALLVAALTTLVASAACGGQDRTAVPVQQPPGCREGLEPARSTFGPADVRIGAAVLMDLRNQQRTAWRKIWDPRKKMAVVKLPIVVPAGGTLTLTVPPQARGIIALYYDTERAPPMRMAEGATTVTISACRGRYPSVGFPGQLLVARPACDVPLRYTYAGAERGLLRLSFGGACPS